MFLHTCRDFRLNGLLVFLCTNMGCDSDFTSALVSISDTHCITTVVTEHILGGGGTVFTYADYGNKKSKYHQKMVIL